MSTASSSSQNLDLSRGATPLDIDGNGKIDPWEMNICRICLLGMLALALGKEALGLVA